MYTEKTKKPKTCQLSYLKETSLVMLRQRFCVCYTGISNMETWIGFGMETVALDGARWCGSKITEQEFPTTSDLTKGFS